MMRPATLQWIGTGLCGALLLSGCNQAQRRQTRMTVTPPQMVQTVPVAPQTPQATVITQLPAPDPVPQPETAVAAPPATPAPEMQQTVYTPVVRKDETVKRRDFSDATAKPCFAHAPNYSWLKGELQYLHSRNAWRLRYASVDDDDKYGGGVTLVEAGRMTGFTSGQMVCVKGEVLDADPKDGFHYRVRSIEPISSNP